jgi:hypothetical protein
MNINQLSKEVYLKTDTVIHYPVFYKGGPKYKNIRCIEIIGFERLKKDPPVGIYKSPNYGYGFTKILKAFAVYLDEKIKVKKVMIEKGCKPKIDRKKRIIWFNQDTLLRIKDVFESLEKKHKAESAQQASVELNAIFPNDIKINIAKYTPDDLFLSLGRWNNSIQSFSEKDRNALNELFDKLSLTDNFFSNNSLNKTKQIIDTKYISSCYEEFATLLNKKDTSTLEKKWQSFLKEKNWIFLYIFSQPIILYQKEAYVGGKSIENKDGKFVDFLGKNKLTKNIALLEIKTHKTKLVEDVPYRGTDVFCISKELSGAINQVLNQRDTLQKSYANLHDKSDGDFKQFNSPCIVLIGSVSDLTERQQECFELFRSNSKDVEIVTFDELFEKIGFFQNLLKTKEPPHAQT